MSFLGEPRTGYLSRWQLHLDALTVARDNYRGETDVPLLSDVLSKQVEYRQLLSTQAGAEHGKLGDDELMRRHHAQMSRLRDDYRQSLEAFMLLKGYVPVHERLRAEDRKRFVQLLV